jgi:protein MpaA
VVETPAAPGDAGVAAAPVYASDSTAQDEAAFIEEAGKGADIALLDPGGELAPPDEHGSASHHASNADHDDTHALQASVNALCEQIGAKLGSVSVDDCLGQGFTFGGGFSVNKRPLVIKDYQPAQDNGFRVLIMGGIHGDEYSSISILFKWLSRFSPDAVEGAFHWRFAPLVNPDGLLDGDKAKRQNANGVDLNRNFPSRDWNDKAVQYWQESTGRNPRRFPGDEPGSEPEVQWIVQQIEEFQPDVIVSVHAPYHLLDFDGPAEAPAKIGELYLNQLGVYPGSLGTFAGLNREIPVVTLELPSAGIMPPAEQIDQMWKDLVAWLNREGRRNLAQL